MRRARIVERDEIAARRGLAARRADLAREAARMRAEIAAERAAILEEARAEAARQAARAGARALAEAEALAEARLAALEPQVAGLVADTVREVVGALGPEAAARAATREALVRLRTHRRARVSAAPDMIEAVRAGVAEAGPAGAEVVAVSVDPRLEPGRATLSSDRGHAEIGLGDQLAAVLEPWAEAAGGEADDVPA